MHKQLRNDVMYTGCQRKRSGSQYDHKNIGGYRRECCEESKVVPCHSWLVLMGEEAVAQSSLKQYFHEHKAVLNFYSRAIQRLLTVLVHYKGPFFTLLVLSVPEEHSKA